MKKFLIAFIIIISSLTYARATNLLDNIQFIKSGWLDVVYNSGYSYNLFHFDSKDNLIFYSIYGSLLFEKDTGIITGKPCIVKYDNYGRNILRQNFKIINDYNHMINIDDLKLDNEDNIIFTGMVPDSVEYDGVEIKPIENTKCSGYILKCDKNGKFGWIKYLKLDYLAYCEPKICTDINNNIYLLAFVNNWLEVDSIRLESTSGSNFCILKFSPEGKCLWAKDYKIGSTNFGDYSWHFKYRQISYDNGNVYLSILQYDTIFAGNQKIYKSSFGNSFGIINIDTASGNIKDVYEIGTTCINIKTDESSPMSFKIKNKSLYIQSNFSNDITLGTTTLKPTKFSKGTVCNSFVLKYDIDKKEIKWLKQMKSDTGRLYLNNAYDKRGNWIIDDKIYLTTTFYSGALKLDNVTILRLDSVSTNNVLCVCDTNGNWKDFDYLCGTNWNTTGLEISNDGEIYMYGSYSGTVKFNDKVRISFKDSLRKTDYFLLKIGNKCEGESFDYPDFSKPNGLILIADACRDNNKNLYITLTHSEDYLSGSLQHYKVNVQNGFTTEFSFRMKNGYNNINDGSSPGGDGLAFVIYDNMYFTAGEKGGGIGYSGIKNSLAVEFDTYNDNKISNINDPDGNHIGVFCAGAAPNVSDHNPKACLGTQTNIIVLKADSTRYYSKIEYDAVSRKLLVYLDTLSYFGTPVMVLDNINLNSLLNIPDGKAFIGFTAATGLAKETHEILSWHYCPSIFSPVNSVEEDKINREDERISGYPNPFTSIATVEFNLETAGKTDISLYDIFGKEIKRIYSGELQVGEQKVNISSEGLSAGIYFVRVQRSNEIKVLKLEFIR